jgi:outer membrane protein OmpA-like peptidoglycan-associated protein
MLGRITGALFTLGLLAAPAFGQQAGRVALGGFLQWTAFDNSLRMDDFFASGIQIGVPLTGAFAVEGDISRVITNGPPGIRISYLPIRARLLYSAPLRGRTSVHAGAGYVHNSYGDSRDGSDNGATAMAGLLFGVTPRLALRLDLNADYMPSPANSATGASENWNLGLRQGMTIALGRTAPRAVAVPIRLDADGDGIADGSDRCPGTPAGVAVDMNGCPLDSDGDGVPDQFDRCAGTAAGTSVDAMGCPLDSDGDGVTDLLDRCPNTPSGTAVDATGCALDSDGDGVPNAVDRCPDTPAGTVVDAHGCQLDSDGDGVPDATDRCPDTIAGSRVDATGCLLLFEENRTSLILEGVNFANGKSLLTGESEAILDNVAASLAVHDSIRVAVDGHTSITGTRALNVRLSHDRADAVKAYLVGRGIAESRLLTRGFGPDRPIASNTTSEGQAKNRRTELSKLD